ncbi:MAG: ATP-dependent DNA ligase [Nanoarchaeota archaeon]
MNYSELVKVYLELEKTPKKLEKADILAEFLKHVPKDEIKDIIHLLQGKIFAEYDERKIGMSSRLVLKVIASSTGNSADEVEKIWKELGDLGKVAELLMKKRKQMTLFRKDLTIKKVSENIRRLAEFEGQGTVDKKVNLIVELLNSSSPEEARFVIGTILEELRVGVASGMIRDALSKLSNVDVEEIEKAYNLTTDYGEVAELLKEDGAKSLGKISLKPGIPIKSMLAILAEDVDETFEALGKPAQFEYKLDGFRVSIHKDKDIKIFTRNLENVTKQFPDIIKYVKENIKAKNFILDGEAVAYDKKTKKHLSFQTISRRIKRKYEIYEMVKKFPIELNLFDVIYCNGRSLINEPLLKRREILESITKQVSGKIILTKKLITDNRKKAKKFFEESLKEGNEGLMIKNVEAIYVPGRYVKGWMKLKNVLEPLDLVVVRAEHGEGKRSKWITSYTIACKSGNELLEVGKVSTGVKEKGEDLTYNKMTEMLKPLIIKESGREITVKPKIILEVGYEEIQKSPSYGSGFALRFPKVLRERTSEKNLSEINTIKDIKKIYNSQRGKKL